MPSKVAPAVRHTANRGTAMDKAACPSPAERGAKEKPRLSPSVASAFTTRNCCRQPLQVRAAPELWGWPLSISPSSPAAGRFSQPSHRRPSLLSSDHAAPPRALLTSRRFFPGNRGNPAHTPSFSGLDGKRGKGFPFPRDKPDYPGREPEANDTFSRPLPCKIPPAKGHHYFGSGILLWL